MLCSFARNWSYSKISRWQAATVAYLSCVRKEKNLQNRNEPLIYGCFCSTKMEYEVYQDHRQNEWRKAMKINEVAEWDSFLEQVSGIHSLQAEHENIWAIISC